MNDLARTVEALLFLSPQPVSAADLAEATEATEGQVDEAIELLREDLAEGRRGIVLREVAGGFTLASDPGQRGGGAAPAGEAADAAADPGPGRDAGDRRLPAAGLAAGGRADPRRLLGVGGADARRARPDRGVRPLAASAPRSSRPRELFERLFGLSGLDQLPDPSQFDPTPEDERELRERLLKAGEQRAEP